MDAVEESGGGSRLHLKVITGAPEATFPAGYDEWRGRVKVKLRSQPRDGEANAELLDVLADRLSVEGCRIESGRRSDRKTVHLPLPPGEVEEVVRDGLDR